MIKGQKHSKISLQKMSKVHKGFKMSEAQKEKIRQAHLKSGLKPPSTLGSKRSEEFKKNASDRAKGNKHWLGKNHSEESKRKISEAQRGEKAFQWQGGISSLQQVLRHSFEYKLWRTRVFERDGYICQNKECGQVGGILNADHIKPFSIILRENNIKTVDDAVSCKELWILENGRTLCKKCHQKTDTYGSKSIIHNRINKQLIV